MKKFRIFSIIVAVVLVAATVIGIRMATVETELFLVQTYELPELANLDDLADLGYGQWAAAIDGVVAACGSATDAADGSTEAENTAADTTEDAAIATDVAICDSLPTRPTASTAKMILALAIITEKPLGPEDKGPEITINDEYYNRYIWYINNGGSNTAVARGEVISEYDALMSVMLASSNNMADTLAMWAFGSLDNYREYATRMLQDLGIMHTTIGPDASGFDEGTISTAADLAKIGEKVLENPILSEIVGTESYTVPVAGTLTNSNTNLGRNGVVGVKTGWIGEPSGYCLVSGYWEGEHVVTVAVLGAGSRYQSMEDSNTIVESLQAKLNPIMLVNQDAEVGHYESWWTGQVPIYASEAMTDLAWGEGESELTEANLKISLKNGEKLVKTHTKTEVAKEPSLWERFLRVLGLL